jgi:PKHD-type hydroxylase
MAHLNPYLVFNQKPADMTDYYWFKEGFTRDEIDKIINDFSTLPIEEAGIASKASGNLLYEVRKSQIQWVPQNQKFLWIYERLAGMIKEANDAIWGFDLHAITDAIQFTQYQAGGGHYDWHMDIGPNELSQRKVSLTIQMSDDYEYEGGELEFNKGGTTPEKAPRGKGVVVVFPSYLLHRVTEVTKGTRKSMVLWVGGGHYK